MARITDSRHYLLCRKGGQNRTIHLVDSLTVEAAVYQEKMTEFRAVGGDGVEYVVKGFRTRVDPGEAFDVGIPSADPAHWQYFASVPPINRGYATERLEKGRYRIVDKDITLTSEDPKAP